jgi:adenosylhomocysteinase
MKDGAILANSGHGNAEIDLAALAGRAQFRQQVRPFVEEFTLPGGKRIYVLGEGRLVNVAAAEGHPAIVMDMGFGSQALGAEHIVTHGRAMAPGVHAVPRAIDVEIARLKLASMEIHIDAVTAEPESHLSSPAHGT